MTDLQKTTRIVDQSLLNFVKTLPCMACGKTPSDPDHVTTRGAGGDDVAVNVWPLCREHHNERHAHGLGFMVETYHGCLMWLRRAKRTDIFELIERKKDD